MSVYALKPKFQNLLRPLVRVLAKSGVTANQVTVFAAAGSILVGLIAGLGTHRAWFLLIPVWLFLRMALNAIDGMLAREFGQKSALGAYFNELGDVVSDIALALPFLAVPVFLPAQIWAFALAAAVVECAGLVGPLAGASRRYDGPLGKSDRAVAVGAFGLWIGLGLPLAPVAGWIWWALVVLAAITTIKRVRNGVAEVR
ncbi:MULTISPECIES: CDP-alcohol phosphatidyltransferase family protein [Paraburkholderia]|uniref:CDP-alcohol phosphatidyltransferase family protein n=1 Tax=Paraburkholderia TaxID=1822464 RepID=UPI00224E9FC8|nr:MULTISPECIES: CDP-alcohol phosphatidyltransferase family protein [Paraburkholderia]MCX4163288.1 CDP-alcohol phosphatidyltransferase family protein [Paraburkholderia megapolitana]MDN7158784.1 CDP-alcohol phosphatidyltransferase family protein [Paraburkholderia sp. CHISQ3]MDQ6495831.1 CDP-alcohol phosphatidyltransferase family protein [Paraburkholderia megapolitana]